MNKYLVSTKYIDWKDSDTLSLARRLAKGCFDPVEIAQRCFEFVRDEIKHSWDHKLNPVTCRASEVLKHRTGYCYAKSHLLAGILRANKIPSGLCYQRLKMTDAPAYCLHGLNAIYLENYGWYRVDARGNKAGVVAEFSPPVEKLAFPVTKGGEADLPEIWVDPLPAVIDVLRNSGTYQEVADNLPDIELVAI